MEIERKFLIKEMPDLSGYECHSLTQAYLNRDPVLRIRKEDDEYYFTYKGKGLMAREEYNLPLNKESFDKLLPKTEGRVIEKKRYIIPYGKYNIELDVFAGELAPLCLAEVEFESVEDANDFEGPDWFGEDVTQDKRYHNSNLSR